MAKHLAVLRDLASWLLALVLILASGNIHAADDDCTVSGPEPYLIQSKVKGYSFDKTKGTETATLDDGAVVTIKTDGCVDSRVVTFSFRIKTRSKASPSAALATAIRELGAVPVNKGGIGYRDRLLEFIRNRKLFAKAPLELKMCLNDSPPDDGDCGFSSGGWKLYRAKPGADALVVEIEWGDSV